MIIIRLIGGLGNQMFQYAFGEAIKARGCEQQIKYDTTYYNMSFAHTGMALEKFFNISLDIATEKEVKRLYPGSVYPERYKKMKRIERAIWHRCQRFREKTMSSKCSGFLEVPAYLYDRDLFNIVETGDHYIYGFFQNFKYIEAIQDHISDIFSYRRHFHDDVLDIADKMRHEESVAIHVRRGDYVGNAAFDLCDVGYYKNTIDLLKTSGKEKFYFFSDDGDYVRRTFSFLGDIEVYSHGAADCDIDLYLMGCSKKCIIPNSSFSFWGALLGRASTVVAPRYWSNDGTNLNEFELPESWLCIDNVHYAK